MKLYFASGNEHKKEEMERLLGGFELILPKDEGIEFDVEETGTTFIENAMIKAKALYDIVKKPVLSDDSGLIVEALGGAPGIYTARYGEDASGRELSAKEKYLLLLKNMEGEINRKAEFTCAICLMISETEIYVVQENNKGQIALEPSGNGGFGYDPIFIIDACNRVSAELTGEEKDMYSHRGKAARTMLDLMKIKGFANDR